MKKTTIYTILGLIGTALFIGIIRSTGLDNIWLSIQKVSPVVLLLFVSISIINFFLFTLRWKIILNTSNQSRQPLHQLVWYRLATFTLSYLIPSAQIGGEPARVYLLEKNNVMRHIAVSSVIIDKVFELSVNVIFSLITFFVLFWLGVGLKISGLIIVSLAFACLIFFYYMTVRGKGFFIFLFKSLHLDRIHFLKKAEQNIIHTEQVMKEFFHYHTISLLASVAISFICFFLILFEYFVVLYLLGVTPTFTQLLIIAMLPLISYLIPVPGAVGTFEVAQISAFSLANINPLLALPVILIVRFRDLLFVLVGLGYMYKTGITVIRKKIMRI